MTVVRPSHTYDTIVPVAVGSSDYTIIDRIRRGKPVIVHGEGTSLWTLTHADDFARAFIGLCGNPRSHRPRLPHHLRRVADLGPDPARRQRGGGDTDIVIFEARQRVRGDHLDPLGHAKARRAGGDDKGAQPARSLAFAGACERR